MTTWRKSLQSTSSKQQICHVSTEQLLSGKDMANKFGQYLSDKIKNIKTDLESIPNDTEEDKPSTTTRFF